MEGERERGRESEGESKRKRTRENIREKAGHVRQAVIPSTTFLPDAAVGAHHYNPHHLQLQD